MHIGSDQQLPPQSWFIIVSIGSVVYIHVHHLPHISLVGSLSSNAQVDCIKNISHVSSPLFHFQFMWMLLLLTGRVVYDFWEEWTCEYLTG